MTPKDEPFGEAEETMAKIENLELGISKNQYHPNPPRDCEGCGDSFSNRRFLIDGNLNIPGSARANMCAACFINEGLSMASAQGKLYTQLDSGKWLMTAGFPPEG